MTFFCSSFQTDNVIYIYVLGGYLFSSVANMTGRYKWAIFSGIIAVSRSKCDRIFHEKLNISPANMMYCSCINQEELFKYEIPRLSPAAPRCVIINKFRRDIKMSVCVTVFPGIYLRRFNFGIYYLDG